MSADYVVLLRDHVTLCYRSINRIFLQAYVPSGSPFGQVCQYLRWQRGFKIPSSPALGKISDVYVRAIHRFVDQHGHVIRNAKIEDAEAGGKQTRIGFGEEHRHPSQKAGDDAGPDTGSPAQTLRMSEPCSSPGRGSAPC